MSRLKADLDVSFDDWDNDDDSEGEDNPEK